MSTPVHPDRLTFPPDHQEPDLLRSDDGYQNDTIPQNERPGSSCFKQFVRQDCHGVSSLRFIGSTHTIRLEHHSQGNRRWSLTTKHQRCLAQTDYPHLHNSTKFATLTTMDMAILTLTTHINIVRLCHPLQPHDATPWKFHARLRCFRLQSLLLSLCPVSPRL